MRIKFAVSLIVFGAISISGASFAPESESGKVKLGDVKQQNLKEKAFTLRHTGDPVSITRSGETGSTIYGFMSYQDDLDFLGGWYELEPSGKTSRLWTYTYADMGVYMNNGWMRNGHLCGTCVMLLGSEDLVGVYAYQEIDPLTGEVIESRPIDIAYDYTSYFYSAAYDPVADKIFGFGRGADPEDATYYFKSAPADRPEDTVIVKQLDSPGDRCYSLCYSVVDGCLYGVNTRGNLVKVFSDGSMTELFELPVPDFANSKGALAFSPNDGYLLWNPGVYTSISELYAIYPEEERMEKLYRFPIDTQFTFFITPDGPADSSGPASAQLISADFVKNDLNGTLKFRLPDSAMNASPISGTIKWTLFDNGSKLDSGEAQTGSELTIPVVVDQGEHTFRLETSFNGKDGYPRALHKYVGDDVPMTPENVVLSRENVSWDAVTAGAHGGYVDPTAVTYKIYLNNALIGTTSSTEMNVEIDLDRIQDVYRAQVKAVYADHESEPGESEKCVIGKPYSLPMNVKPTEHDGEMVTIINVDGSPEYGMWRLSDSWGDLCFASGWSYNQPDDWLIMPAAEFESNEVIYEVSLEAARGGYSGSLEYFEVWAGNAPTVEAMTIPVIPKTRAQKFNEWKEYSGKFAVPKAGTYYIAIRGCSAPDQKDLIVKNITVSATEEVAAVPSSVSDLEIVESSDADLTATLKFKMPETYLTGEAIPADTKLTVIVQAAERKEIEALPGSEQRVVIGTAQGDNYITVTPVADGIEGTPSEASVFTGMDYLSYCEDFTGTVTADNMSIDLTWRAPDESLYGGYVSSTGIEYMIGQISSMGEFLEDPVCAGVDVTEYTYTLPEGTTQNFIRIGIAAKNAAGISPARSYVGRVMGTPYKLPMVETFPNMQFTYTPMQASAPTSKYTDGSWTWCQPELVNPAFANSEIAFGVIGYTESPEAWVRMGLPRFSTLSLDNAHAVLKIWNGDGSATQKSVYATKYGMPNLEKIADIPMSTGWQDVIVEIPSKYLGEQWIGLYIDGCLPTSENYLIIGGYSIQPTSGTAEMVNTGAVVTRSGEHLLISNPDKDMITVAAANGTILYSGSDAKAEISLPGKGVYMVKAGSRSYKIAF